MYVSHLTPETECLIQGRIAGYSLYFRALDALNLSSRDAAATVGGTYDMHLKVIRRTTGEMRSVTDRDWREILLDTLFDLRLWG